MLQLIMTKKLNKYISINPRVVGGEPVISGTRIPVERVYNLIKQGESVEKLKENYPDVSSKKIQYVIAYLMKAGLDEFKKTQKIQIAS